MLVDSAAAAIVGDAPPPTRTASTLDFRQAAHVADRLGRVHPPTGRKGFNAGMFDGSARTVSPSVGLWIERLP